MSDPVAEKVEAPVIDALAYIDNAFADPVLKAAALQLLEEEKQSYPYSADRYASQMPPMPQLHFEVTCFCFWKRCTNVRQGIRIFTNRVGSRFKR